MGNKVFKASPEEQALASNIVALGDELMAMMSAGGMQPLGAQPGMEPAGSGEEDMSGNVMAGQGASANLDGGDLNPKDGRLQNDIAPKGKLAPKAADGGRDEDNTAIAKAITGAVMKAIAQVRKEDIPSSSKQGHSGLADIEGYAGDPKDLQNDEVAKAIYKAANFIAKAVVATDNEGSDGMAPATFRIVNEIPGQDQDNIEEVTKDIAKALYNAIGGRSSIRKSQGGDNVMSVLKSISARQARQDAVIAEILEGYGASAAVEAEAPRGGRVEKAQGSRRPMAGYDQGQDFADLIAAGVAKALGGGKVGQAPAADDEFNMPVRKSIKSFTSDFAQGAGGLWGQ